MVMKITAISMCLHGLFIAVGKPMGTRLEGGTANREPKKLDKQKGSAHW